MLVRMLACLAGNLVVHEVGDDVVFPDCAAQRLIDAGYAEKVDDKVVEATVERAERKPKAETR